MSRFQISRKSIGKNSKTTKLWIIFLVILCLVLVVTIINRSMTFQAQQSTEMHLQAPIVSDKIHSNRPPFRFSTNGTRRRLKPKKIGNKDLINPCVGPYMKTNGTTCGLKEMMIGRCYEFEYVKRGFFLSNQS